MKWCSFALAALGIFAFISGCRPTPDPVDLDLQRIERCVAASFAWEDAPPEERREALVASIETAEAVCPKGGFYGACMPDLEAVAVLAAVSPEEKIPTLVDLCVQELCPDLVEPTTLCEVGTRRLLDPDRAAVERDIVEFHVQLLNYETGATERHAPRVQALAETMSRVWIGHVRAQPLVEAAENR